MSSAYELDRKHVFHSWAAQAEISPMVITAARGSYVWDDEDRRYLDCARQLVFTNIGHQHPRVIAAIKEQADRLCTIAPAMANEQRAQAAELIAEIAPDGFTKVFFTNGGADANEHAVRMARLQTGRFKVLTAYRSYHGGTQTAINLTGDPRRFANDTATAGAVHFFGPFLYRSEFHATTEEEECDRALAHLRRTIEAEGPQTIAAILLETIPGTAGIFAPPPGYLAGVRALCDELAATFDHTPYPGGLTYSGHPLACAAAVATIHTMRDEGIVENADRLGREIFGPSLAEIAERHACVGEVRGVGAFWALDLVTDPDSKAMLPPAGVNDVVAACKSAGLLPFANTNRIHVVPPCTMSDDEAREGLAILDEALCG